MRVCACLNQGLSSSLVAFRSIKKEWGYEVETLTQAMKNLGPMRLAIVGAVLMAVVGLFIFVVTKVSTPSMDILYNDLAQEESNKIINELQAKGIPFQRKLGGTQILVPSEHIASSRLALASQGLPGGGNLGFELFDKGDSLGTTSFMQNVNLVRAMEGELSRTIQTLNSVKSARVHLVLPKRELFSRQRQEPTASIVLKMRSAGRLPNEEINAVKHLVSTAVPGLSPERISIIDNKGKLLASGGKEGDSVNSQALKVEQRQRQFETRLAQTIEELLERTVGFGKVRAEVTAELDFDRISTKSEEYNPDGQVVRSTHSIEEANKSADAEGTTSVSVGTNLPDPNIDGGDSQSSTNDESRTEEIVNFEISKKITNHVRETGTINRLSVAVLIDGLHVENDDGDLEYQPRTEEDLTLLATLVRSAIGFNAERGDIVEVVNMEFADYEAPEEPLNLFFGLEKNDMLRLAESLVLVILVLLVILLVFRPLISRAFERLPSASEMTESLLADHGAGTPALSGPGMPGVPVPSDMDGEEEQFEELIDIDRVEGRVKASSVKKVGEIVEKHPEEALSIIRSWMYQEA